MKFLPTSLPGLLVLEPNVCHDDRGHFLEAFNQRVFSAAGVPLEVAQINYAYSKKGVLRGLHYQFPHPQAKIVRCVGGEVFDVAVDLRASSPTFRHWFGIALSAENGKQLFIPVGFAHGYYVPGDMAAVEYVVSDFFDPHCEHGIRWNDPEIGIAWPFGTDPLVSAKDRNLPSFSPETVLFS